jgi:8-oxo-dGTP diphosphatase
VPGKSQLHRLALEVFQRLPRWGRRFVVRRAAPAYTVGAVCVIEDGNGRILLVRHSYRNHWGLPGGLLARDEEAVDAARREVQEEVGIDVEVVGEPAVVVEAKYRRVDVVYAARLAGPGDAEHAHPVSAEIEAAAWHDVRHLPRLDREAAKSVAAWDRAGRGKG